MTNTPRFKVVQGGKTDSPDAAALHRLLDRAGTVAYQWQHAQLGGRGQVRLIEAFRERMPGLSDELIHISGPAILTAIIDRAQEEELNEETIAFLTHILEPPRSPRAKAEEEGFEGEVQRIRAELALISENWGLHVDSDGGYIDIFGEARMPAGVQEGEGGELRPTYAPHHHIATIYTDGALKSEQITNAKFAVMAPRRIEWLIGLIERLMSALPKK